MSPGYVPRSRECVPWGVAIRGGCHKHELLKITDKLIFSPLIISNRFTFLIIKYTFSSKLFSSTAYINMRTQAGKSTWLRKHTATADKQKWRWEQSHSGGSTPSETQGFTCAEWTAIMWRTFLVTLLPYVWWAKWASRQGRWAHLLATLPSCQVPRYHPHFKQ